MTSFAESLAVLPMQPRCAATTRTPRGYEMCHRNQHADTEPHHVKDRSWYSGQFPRMRLMVPCGEACGWPDYVQPYYGCQPGASTVGGGRGYVPPARPARARPPDDPARSHHGQRRTG